MPQFFEKNDLTANTLKYVAIILMFLDHFFAVFGEHDTWFGVSSRIPGRIVAPVMCYLIAEGFFYTSNIRKYIERLFLFAVISHFFYVLYFQLPWWRATSVFWGLTLGLVALCAIKNEKLPNWQKAGVLLICCALAIPANWNYISVLWIVGFGVFRGDFFKQMLVFTAIGLVFHAFPALFRFGGHHGYQFAFLLAIPLLALYKGRRGAHNTLSKWGFYLFYPLHLLVLYIIRNIVLLEV